ncbi:MAG: iron-containing redox enzyme family protein [Pseudanabaenales cyanobacterium]|nr:iron-containing redox enzyme family protein [Pseudanabaenales cyanobacterium]
MAHPIRQLIETQYQQQVQSFEQSTLWRQLEQGQTSPNAYDAFLANLCKTHLKSPQILAFLYSVAPPAAADQLKHNLLEELGLDKAHICHPDLLYQLATAAGFDPAQQKKLTQAAQDQIRTLCTDPLLFGTIYELGLSVLLEVTCFEWMLSRLASRIGKALEKHRGLSPESLVWFYHHSEVDIRHAEEGLDSVEQYVAYYEIELDELETILDITFRENIFIKHYFGELALAQANQMLEPLS